MPSMNNSDYEQDLRSKLSSMIVGQDHVIDPMVEMVMTHKVGLSPENRPAGIYMLLGLSGSGKTLSVEALANALHGSKTNMLKIDCGEYQMDHEVAKLLGAPPGYLGHRETTPLLTQMRLASSASDKSLLSILLFDEIEKAAPALSRLLLGIMDKGNLRLGDNTSVNFENTIIFMTSNVGTKALDGLFNPMGYGGPSSEGKELESNVNASFKKSFSPEFRNRIDHALVYNRLSKEDLCRIFKIEMSNLCDHIKRRLAVHMQIEYPKSVIDYVIATGDSYEYGARNIKRIIQRQVLSQIVRMAEAGLPRKVTLEVKDGKINLIAEASA
jgi:ATP-dependent Clp protease ATP-binding subunit ClpA